MQTGRSALRGADAGDQTLVLGWPAGTLNGLQQPELSGAGLCGTGPEIELQLPRWVSQGGGVAMPSPRLECVFWSGIRCIGQWPLHRGLVLDTQAASIAPRRRNKKIVGQRLHPAFETDHQVMPGRQLRVARGRHIEHRLRCFGRFHQAQGVFATIGHQTLDQWRLVGGRMIQPRCVAKRPPLVACFAPEKTQQGSCISGRVDVREDALRLGQFGYGQVQFAEHVIAVPCPLAVDAQPVQFAPVALDEASQLRVQVHGHRAGCVCAGPLHEPGVIGWATHCRPAPSGRSTVYRGSRFISWLPAMPCQLAAGAC